MTPLLPQRPDGRYELRLDASLLSESSCSRRIYHLLLEGLKPREDTWKMDFGTAVHKFLASWYGGKSQQYALDAALNYYREIPVPETDWRDLTALEKVCEGYVRAWPESDDPIQCIITDKHDEAVLCGLPPLSDYALEKHFEIEWLSNDTLVVILCGTMDFRGVIRRPDGSEEKVIVDHKTHSIKADMTLSKIPPHIDDFLFTGVRSLQGGVYRLAAKKLWGEDYSFMINGVFMMRNGKHRYERSSLFNDYSLEDIEADLNDIINDLVSRFERKLKGESEKTAFPMRRMACYKPFRCKFLPICDAPSADQVEFIKRECFTAELRDPRQFQK